MILHRQFFLAAFCLCFNSQNLAIAHDQFESFQLRYWKDYEQYFETETYTVSLTISDGNTEPDHTVSISAKTTDFHTAVPLGLQGGAVPIIEDITQVYLCNLELLTIDFRWPFNGEILTNGYERLFIDRSNGKLVATLDDIMSSNSLGFFPAENIKLFYKVLCGQEVRFKPKSYEKIEGGGIILLDRPGH